jgi:hypothetical protein
MPHMGHAPGQASDSNQAAQQAYTYEKGRWYARHAAEVAVKFHSMTPGQQSSFYIHYNGDSWISNSAVIVDGPPAVYASAAIPSATLANTLSQSGSDVYEDFVAVSNMMASIYADKPVRPPRH